MPIPFIYISIYEGLFSDSLFQTIDPISLIYRTIRPLDDAIAMRNFGNSSITCYNIYRVSIIFDPILRWYVWWINFITVLDHLKSISIELISRFEFWPAECLFVITNVIADGVIVEVSFVDWCFLLFIILIHIKLISSNSIGRNAFWHYICICCFTTILISHLVLFCNIKIKI